MGSEDKRYATHTASDITHYYTTLLPVPVVEDTTLVAALSTY